MISHSWPRNKRFPNGNKKAMSRMVSSPAHGLNNKAVAQDALHAPFRRAASKTEIHGISKHIHL